MKKLFALSLFFFALITLDAQTLLCLGDADSQSDNKGHTNPQINISRYNYAFVAFDTKGLKAGFYSARLELSFTDLKSELELSVFSADNQEWREGDLLPKDELELVTARFDRASKTLEIPKLEISKGQGQLVLVLSADTNNWNLFSSRSGKNPPKLILGSPIAEVISERPQPIKSPMTLGTNFWFMADWSGEKPFKKDVDFSKAANSSENIWNPVFLKDLEPFAVLRFMDWGGTNNSKVRAWADRRPATDKANAQIDYIGPGDALRPGLAYEWMIDLANRTKKSMWICVPHLSNDDYVRELAELIKKKLDKDLDLYLEYSNETWNGMFTQFEYCLEQGVRLGLPGDNKWYQGGAYSLYRSYQIFEIFDRVYGAEARARVNRVVSFSGNFDIFAQSYKALVANTQFNPKNQKPDYVAVAPYVGFELDGSDKQIVQKWEKELGKVLRDYVKPASAIAKQFGLTLIAYEGGQHLLKNANLWSRNPAIYEAYTNMLNQFSSYFVLFNHYALTGTWSSDGAWGAKESTGQSETDAPKYKALRDFILK